MTARHHLVVFVPNLGLKAEWEGAVKSAVACLLAIALVCGQAAAQPTTDGREAQVEALFAKFTADTPGCAVGVEQDGVTLLRKGYGSADLAHGIPITTKTRFYMGSVSKQFTAMTILLLIKDGKLGLDDPIRKYLPELPAWADKVTIHNLLNHTGATGDYFGPGYFAGLPADYAYTEDDVLRIASRDHDLGQAPGSKYAYSNTGYVLLSIIASRVGGAPFNVQAHDRIFAPLGMNSTLFQTDHTDPVPDKATGYLNQHGGWHEANITIDTMGDGGLYSSVDDMLLWMRNFDAPKVGAEAVDLMRTPSKFANGDPLPFYGMGLFLPKRRGLQAVEHTGQLNGYVTFDLMFPSEKLGVVVLCNSPSAPILRLAPSVAEVYLASRMDPPPAKVALAMPPAIPLSASEARSKAGLYRNAQGDYRILAEREGKLYMPGRGLDLVQVKPDQFVLEGLPDGGRIVFDPKGQDQWLEFADPGQTPVRFEHLHPVDLSSEALEAYAGTYWCDELGSDYELGTDGKVLSLVARGHPLLADGIPVSALQSIGVDKMVLLMRSLGVMEVHFVRDGAGHVTGFTADSVTLNLKGLVFKRI